MIKELLCSAELHFKLQALPQAFVYLCSAPLMSNEVLTERQNVSVMRKNYLGDGLA
jgi:hypothetical protein